MKWFAVQFVFQHAVLKRKKAMYEERIVLYRARSSVQAVSRAKKDAAEYLENNPQFKQLSSQFVYVLADDRTDLDATEVWSYLYHGTSDPEEFWRERFERFALRE